MELAYVVIVVVILAILVMWWLGVYDVYYPAPNRPDGNFTQLISAYESHPVELWFRNNKVAFDKALLCLRYRYIVYESDGSIVYDSSKREGWEGKCYFPELESSRQLTKSVEYIRAAALTQGVVVRGHTNNLCELAKIGDRYRIVHVSEYIFNECDEKY